MVAQKSDHRPTMQHSAIKRANRSTARNRCDIQLHRQDSITDTRGARCIAKLMTAGLKWSVDEAELKLAFVEICW